MTHIFLFFVLGMSLVACNNSKPEQDLSIAPLKSTTTDTSANNSAASQALPQQMPAIPTSGMPKTQTAMPQNVTTGNTAAGMNPEHGKPGHRCEINVGAPLSSAPARTATAPTTAVVVKKSLLLNEFFLVMIFVFKWISIYLKNLFYNYGTIWFTYNPESNAFNVGIPPDTFRLLRIGFQPVGCTRKTSRCRSEVFGIK